MALSFAKRIVGYGCWTLHADKEWGKFGTVTNNLTLLTFLRTLYKKVNHIKVILFRNPKLEVPDDRVIPLYRDGTINQALIDNLKSLVDEAAKQGFWVQICIWHHHAIADPNEYPESAPTILAPKWELEAGPRLAAYYAPSAARQAAFAEQRKLFERIGRDFGGYDNVIFELGNEMRIWDSDHKPAPNQNELDPAKVGDELNLKAWLANHLQALRASAPGPIRVCTSTGIDNEYTLFKPANGLNVDYFDFHAGEWGMFGFKGTGYPAGIRGCRDNAAVYKPGGKVLINADGLFHGQTLASSAEFASYMEFWASEAFQKGVSFVTKGWYPPKVPNISKPMLDALERAANAVPDA